MGTSRVTIRKTATRKDGNSKGTVKATTAVKTNGTRASAAKSRKIHVNAIKDS